MVNKISFIFIGVYLIYFSLILSYLSHSSSLIYPGFRLLRSLASQKYSKVAGFSLRSTRRGASLLRTHRGCFAGRSRISKPIILLLFILKLSLSILVWQYYYSFLRACFYCLCCYLRAPCRVMLRSRPRSKQKQQ